MPDSTADADETGCVQLVIAPALRQLQPAPLATLRVHGRRLRGLIVILGRAGLRVGEALSSAKRISMRAAAR